MTVAPPSYQTGPRSPKAKDSRVRRAAVSLGWFFAPMVPLLVAIIVGYLQSSSGHDVPTTSGDGIYLLTASRGLCNVFLWFTLFARSVLPSTSPARRKLLHGAGFFVAAAASVAFEVRYQSAMLAIAWGGGTFSFTHAFAVALVTYGSTSAIMTLCATASISRSSLVTVTWFALLVALVRSIPLFGALLDYLVVGATFAMLANQEELRLADTSHVS